MANSPTRKATRQSNCIKLQGDLLFSTVVAVREELQPLLKDPGEQLSIDFADVSRVDSSALSLWLCLQRFARQYNVKLQAVNVPSELASIARLVGLYESGPGI